MSTPAWVQRQPVVSVTDDDVANVCERRAVCLRRMKFFNQDAINKAAFTLEVATGYIRRRVLWAVFGKVSAGFWLLAFIGWVVRSVTVDV